MSDGIGLEAANVAISDEEIVKKSNRWRYGALLKF
jgi:hypothetical protein